MTVLVLICYSHIGRNSTNTLFPVLFHQYIYTQNISSHVLQTARPAEVESVLLVLGQVHVTAYFNQEEDIGEEDQVMSAFHCLQSIPYSIRYPVNNLCDVLCLAH